MKNVILTIALITSILPAIGQHGGSGSVLDSSTHYGPYPGKSMNLGVKDTVPVVMLICDTSHYFRTRMEIKTCQEIGCTDTTDLHKFASHFVEIKEDRGNGSSGPTHWMMGYTVREYLGNYSASNNTFLVYHTEPVYRHIEYLGNDKKPLEYKIVWMAKEIK